jgi:hypothetical protein
MQIPNSACFVQAYLLITNNMIAVSVKEYQTDKRVYFKICGNCSTEIVFGSKDTAFSTNRAIRHGLLDLKYTGFTHPMPSIMYQDEIRLSLEQIATRYQSANVVIL